MRRYAVLDVFTDEPLAGNPLAVVLDAEGLADSRMQAIAREFNLSETVFVLPPREGRHRASLRIFTPAGELPFAGHPTVGTAVLLALKGGDPTDAIAFGLEEKVGIVPCVVQKHGERRGHARFRLPRLPAPEGEAPDEIATAWALGLDPADFPDQLDPAHWRERGDALAAIFSTASRAEWVARFEPFDACLTPVLTLAEAVAHPANAVRGVHLPAPGGVQPAFAPRLSATPAQVGAVPDGSPDAAADRLVAWGLDPDHARALAAAR